MVLPGQREYMATGRERSKHLHNFTLPYLTWGNQRQLRCMKVESASGGAAEDHRFPRRYSSSKLDNSPEPISARFVESELGNKIQHRRWRAAPYRLGEDGAGGEGIDDVREKIMSDLRTEADKLKESIFTKEALEYEDQKEETGRIEREKQNEKEKERDVSPTDAAAAAATEEARPWNLRTRRAVGGAGNNSGTGNYNSKELGIEERRANSSPLRNDSTKLPRVRERQKEEWQQFSVSLTRKEIEEDFMELLGRRPLRRPKKRLRTVQKQLDFLFPGLYMTEVSHDLYKIPDSAENGKR